MLLRKDLGPLKNAAIRKVDREAGAIRCRFITDIPGQDMIYQQKRLEAEALMANPAIALPEIPHIVAEAALNEVTPFDQAVIILTMAEQWKAISAPIERERMAAKTRIAAATTPAEIEVAAIVDWAAVLPAA
jgi:hypothetical protein